MIPTNRFSKALLSCAVISAMAGGQAVAEESAGARSLEEVVVSARKRDETVQTVPIAISTLTAKEIEGSFANQLDQIKGVPNVALDQAPGFRNVAAFYIRGIGYQDIDLTFEPAVGVVVDGIFLSKANGQLLDVFGLESMEILRGPQGTLFGKNTIGGVVNVRTKRPSGEVGVELRAKYGNYGRNDYRAAFEAPITDNAAMRISLLSNRNDGYAENTADNNDLVGAEDSQMARATFTFGPTDTLDFTLIADAIHDRSEASPMRNTSINLGEPGPLLNLLPLIGFPGSTATEGDEMLKVRQDIDGPFNVDGYGVSLEVNWDMGGATLTSLTGYRTQDEETDTDVGGEATTLFHLPRTADFDQLYQEFRLASALFDDKLELVTGVNYLQAKHNQNLGFLLDSNLLTFPASVAPPGALNTTLDTPQTQDATTTGVFAQGDYSITEDWRVTLGVRYSRETKDYTYTETGFADNNFGTQGLSLWSLSAFQGGQIPSPLPRQTGQFDADFNKTTWRIGTDYQINYDTFVYFSFSTGFKAGGFNGRATSFTQVGPYQPETVDSYEIGLKTSFFDNRLRVNSALFSNEYEDLQVEILKVVNGANTTLVDNAAAATIRGFETEVSALLGDDWTAQASVGYLDAKYNGFDADVFSRGFDADNSHLKLRRAPEWTLGAAINYEHAFSFGLLSWQLDWSYTSDYETNVQNYDFGTHRSENLFNSNIGYKTPDEKYGVTLFVRNITDEVRVMSSNPIPPFSSFNQPTNPRTYGIELSAKF